MNQQQGGAAAARRVHTPEVAGSTPALATRTPLACRSHCVLEAINRVSGRDRSEIVREILHNWALEKIHESTVLDGLLAAQGITAARGGN